MGLGFGLTSAMYFIHRIFFSKTTPEIIFSELVELVNKGEVK